MIDLSVIILNYNNCALLNECLRSAIDSTHKIEFEVIVIDNGSTDGSVQMVKENFPSAKVIENSQNLGFTKANNLGLKIAVGRYIVLLNNDTKVQGGAFNKLIDFMDKNIRAGACGPKLLNDDGSPQRQGGLLGTRFWASEKPAETSFITGACLLVRKEVLKNVGLLDENLYFYNDDLDWCKRIRGAGWKIFFVPQARVIHYGGYSTRSSFNKKMFVEGFRGGLYFSRKHYGLLIHSIHRLLLALIFPFSVIGLTLTSLLKGFKEFREKLLAYFEIFKIDLFGPVKYPW